MQHNRVLGIDFSGASRPADSIWISEALAEDNNLTIRETYPAHGLDGITRFSARSDVYEGICELILSDPPALVGLDFPFGLPEALVDDGDEWQRFITGPSKLTWASSADTFREACVEAVVEKNPDASRRYLRRETDIRYAAQCPYSHQIQYQTFYGQQKVLAPLVDEGLVRVPPMQSTIQDKPTLVEVYPAATLGVLRAYRHGYKGHRAAMNRRRHIIDDIEGYSIDGHHRPFNLTSGFDIDVLIENDDALDSVLASIGAYHAMIGGFRCDQKESEIEGQIFA